LSGCWARHHSAADDGDEQVTHQHVRCPHLAAAGRRVDIGVGIARPSANVRFTRVPPGSPFLNGAYSTVTRSPVETNRLVHPKKRASSLGDALSNAKVRAF
jgi:hypothetical protein